MNLRACSRKVASLNVAVHGESGVGRGRARDVGLGGSFLEIRPENFGDGEKLDLWFHLPQHDGKKHQIRATVVRRTENGLGVAFKDPSALDFRTLQEILRAVSG